MAVSEDSVEIAVREGRCLKQPVGCGKQIHLDRQRMIYFSDEIYKREWKATGLCPSCQLKLLAE